MTIHRSSDMSHPGNGAGHRQSDRTIGIRGASGGNDCTVIRREGHYLIRHQIAGRISHDGLYRVGRNTICWLIIMTDGQCATDNSGGSAVGDEGHIHTLAVTVNSCSQVNNRCRHIGQ
ncbi:Uncharacterised protein [Yersinia frederiksenii]|nr:Uncharacterised protein [Yersinia frederiksenii]